MAVFFHEAESLMTKLGMLAPVPPLGVCPRLPEMCRALWSKAAGRCAGIGTGRRTSAEVDQHATVFDDGACQSNGIQTRV